MFITSIVIPVLTLVIIFLFAIGKFSKQIHQTAGAGFKRALGRATKTPIRGIALGTAFTALIQSSTATTVILVGLVDAGLISFSSSLGVILGANIGTTITSQLVALKLTNIAPLFVLTGFLVTYFGGTYKRWGKPIFYFGLVFFTLSLISLYIEPVKSHPSIVGLFAGVGNIYTALLVGLIFTAIVQSSSVTSGLVILLVGVGLLDIVQAIGIILGANIGTTVTALIAASRLNIHARRVAIAHLLFNVLGVLFFLPFVALFVSLVSSLGGSAQQIAANAHLFFNLILATVFFIAIRPFERLVYKLSPAA